MNACLGAIWIFICHSGNCLSHGCNKIWFEHEEQVEIVLLLCNIRVLFELSRKKGARQVREGAWGTGCWLCAITRRQGETPGRSLCPQWGRSWVDQRGTAQGTAGQLAESFARRLVPTKQNGAEKQVVLQVSGPGWAKSETACA